MDKKKRNSESEKRNVEKGDLVRCREFDPSKGRFDIEFTMTGVLVSYDKLMKRADVLINETGTVRTFRANDVQLLKRSLENTNRLKGNLNNDS